MSKMQLGACAKCGHVKDARTWQLEPNCEVCAAREMYPDMHDSILYFQSGTCRNNDRALAHTYAKTKRGELLPMCGYGWNRSDGTRFSIFRGAPLTMGKCQTCKSNLASGKAPIENGWPHKTKWL